MGGEKRDLLWSNHRRGEHEMVSKTKEKLAEAFKTVVCKKSFTKTTIADITKECGMTRENFYYHFRDKYDIIGWVCRHQLVANIPEKYDKKYVEDLIIYLVRKINEDYKFYRTVVRDVGVEQVRKEVLPYIRKLIYRLIDETIDENVWRMREEKENIAVDFISDALITFLTEYMLENEKMDEKLMVMNFHFLFTQFF